MSYDVISLWHKLPVPFDFLRGFYMSWLIPRMRTSRNRKMHFHIFWILPLNDRDDRTPEKRRWQPLRGPPRWAPETDLQWGPHHLDIHRGKTPGTSGPLTLWLCCSWNKLLIRLAGGELAPRLSLVSPKVFSPFCHRWSFRSLPLSPLACSVGDTSLAAQSSTWLHRYYLSWTMPLLNSIMKCIQQIIVLNPVILHWQNLPIVILCSALLQFVLLKALYK